ncbi:hypothetical protein K443DRAFT_679613 [Laccaria amethystina LaAM-08-1]|uniref:Ribophorin II n=1 Tax=Laccaria amethystina LaAM-08-1 TaxID=1095629 RepID=A0A0C9XEA0_9AGAR|nr:hypothetical protein K443DRAFT_679613 [Laccaria amethystina LaAM-08-1]
MFSLLHLSLLAVAAQASLLSLHSPRLTVSDSTGSQLRFEPISLAQDSRIPVELAAKDILKFTFQVVEKDNGKGIQPHQTFLRFYDEKSGEEGIQPIRVTPGGKAKFELNMSKPPLSLPPSTDAPLKVTLLIGSSLYSPLSIDLFDLVVPRSAPAPIHADEASFHLLPEIKHTFRPDQKLPPRPISAIFTVLVLSPWVVLLSLWTQVVPIQTRLLSLNVLPFILSLGAFEGLLLWYWVDLKLGQVLLYGAVLSIPTFFAGKHALSNIASKRLGIRN